MLRKVTHCARRVSVHVCMYVCMYVHVSVCTLYWPTGRPRKSLSGKNQPNTMVISAFSIGPTLTLAEVAPVTWLPFVTPGNWPSDSNCCQSATESSAVPNDGVTCTWGGRKRVGEEEKRKMGIKVEDMVNGNSFYSLCQLHQHIFWIPSTAYQSYTIKTTVEMSSQHILPSQSCYPH